MAIRLIIRMSTRSIVSSRCRRIRLMFVSYIVTHFVIFLNHSIISSHIMCMRRSIIILISMSHRIGHGRVLVARITSSINTRISTRSNVARIICIVTRIVLIIRIIITTMRSTIA